MMDGRATIQLIGSLNMSLMEDLHRIFETAFGFGALLLLCNDRFVVAWINRRLDEPRKKAAKRAGSQDRITRSRYHK